MEKRIGFIGAGTMGSAMIGGILRSGLVSCDAVLASARSKETLKKLQDTYSIQTTLSNEETAKYSDILFLAVKPNKFDEILVQIAPHLAPECIVVSIAAGKTISSMEQTLKKPVKLIRAMPNMPALIGQAMSALCANESVTAEELTLVQKLFCSFGECEIVPEQLMDTVVGISASSPAYVFLFLEAMADAAVADGMPRRQAYKFAAQAVLGSAKMVLETQKHPAELKDAVCSAGGTTIEAVAALEAGNFRSTIITAQRACVKKSQDLSKTNI